MNLDATYKRAVVACIALLVASCSTSGPSVESVIGKRTVLPPHADRSIPIELQSAYMRRGLVLDQRGEVVPANTNACSVYLYWQPESLEQQYLSNNYSALYEGIYLRVVERDRSFFVRAANGDERLLTPKGLKAIKSHLPEQTKFRFDIRGVVQTRELTQINNIISSSLPTQNYSYITDVANTPFLENTFLYAKFIDVEKADRNYAQNFSNDESDQGGNISLATFKILRPNGVKKLTFESLTIKNNLLGVCQRVRNMVYPADPLVDVTRNDALTDLRLISTLPKAADFNQLERQRELMKQGKFLHYDGSVAAFSNEEQKQMSKTVDACENITRKDPAYRYCQKRKSEAVKVESRKIILETGNN